MQGDWDRLDDGALIEAVKDGRIGAFSHLVQRHQRSLVNYFYHLSWDPQGAEDCAQEVFLRLYSHLGTYEPRAKFTTFLFRIARNLWIDRIRSEASHPRPVSLDAPGRPGEERTLGSRVPGASASPQEVLARRETQEALRRAIDRLSEEHRSVLILGELEGMRYQEVGEILDIPVGTVKSRMHAAMERLREMLTDADLT